jgi:transcriptional regulator with GAF, ATPase, and Fis domain
MERAVITNIDGNLNVERALPDLPQQTSPSVESPDTRVWKAAEMEEIERKNLVRALELTGWRISGKDGAAQLLGLRPSTLTSRMKALGIRRPRP